MFGESWRRGMGCLVGLAIFGAGVLIVVVLGGVVTLVWWLL